MADLNVDKRPQRRVWPWFLVLVAAAVVVWWVGFEPSDSANPVVAGGPLPAADAVDTLGLTGDTLSVVGGVPAASVAGAPSAVNDYLGFVAEQRRRAAQPISGDEVADGIRRLADGTEAAAAHTQQNEAMASQRADSLRTMAGLLQREPSGIRQSELAHGAFVLGARLLEQLPSADGGAAAAANAQTAAEAVLPQAELASQGEAIRRYFTAAASALELAARRR